MIERCRETGLPEAEFKLTDGFVTVIRRKAGKAFETVGGKITPEATPEVRLLRALSGEMTRQQLQTALNLKDDEHFRKGYLLSALEAELIEMTIPGKPRSSKQKYRLTEKGKQILNQDI